MNLFIVKIILTWIFQIVITQRLGNDEPDFNLELVILNKSFRENEDSYL